MTYFRDCYKIGPTNPGSDLAAETAAALAASSIFYKSVGMSSDAASVLQTAKDLFTLANTYQGIYSNSIPNGQRFYKYVQPFIGLIFPEIVINLFLS